MRIWLQGRRMLTRQMGAVRKKNTLRETARRIRSIILPDDEAGRRGPRNRIDVSFPFEFNPDGRTTFHFTLPAVTAEEIGIPVMPHGLAQFDTSSAAHEPLSYRCRRYLWRRPRSRPPVAC